MLKLRILVVFLVAALLSGCEVIQTISIEGSGNVVAQEKDIVDFDKVDVSSAFKVNLRRGDSFRVVVRVDDNLVQYLRVVKQGRTLKIGMEPGLRLFAGATREAEVTLPELTGLDLSGASYGTITGFSSTKAIDVDVSGASHLLGNIDAGDARFDVSGASQVNLSGSAQDLIIDASGASQVKLADFPVEDATVEASGATKVTVNPKGRLDADASGASRVHYLGDPELGNIDTSGASDVVKPW